jgi:hypothetical protein
VHRAFGLSGIIQKFNTQGILEASRQFGAPKPRSLKNQSFNSGPRKKRTDDNKLPHGNGVNITSREPRCGREESTPRAAPLRHWKGILSRTSGGFCFWRDFDSVLEFDTLDDFRQLVLTLQSSPSFRRGHHQLENHETSGVLRQRAFHADRAMPDRREYPFNRIVVRKWSQ